MRILEYPKDQKMLRSPGKVVTPLDLETPEFHVAIKKMQEVLAQEKNGIGLAATQVEGFPFKLFILNCNEDFKPSEIRIFLNPVIKSESKQVLSNSEGCLSFNGLTLKIKRPERIEWEYYDLSFRLCSIKSEGYFARAIMHEIDHLNGRLLIDRISSTERLKFERWLKNR
jgi:peptide deformylase